MYKFLSKLNSNSMTLIISQFNNNILFYNRTKKALIKFLAQKDNP